MLEKFGAFLVKPDAIDLGLEQQLVSDIPKYGLNIEHVKQTSPLTAKELRGVWAGNDFESRIWTSMEKRNFNKTSTLIVVSDGLYVDEKIKKTKLDLRIKYDAPTKEFCEKICSNEDDFAEMVGANRIHGTDGKEEFYWICQTLLTGRDMDGIRVTNKRLFKKLNNIL